MSDTLITDKGKTELLRLGFKSEEAGGAFNFMALGQGSSGGAQNGDAGWREVTGSGYHRVQTVVDKIEEKSITISATFDETNYAPTNNEGGQVKEIGICNSSSSQDTFFLYSEVPAIYKTGDISLQYTVIISID